MENKSKLNNKFEKLPERAPIKIKFSNQRRRGVNWIIFKKTESEKKALKMAKYAHNKLLREAYGPNWKKYQNVSDK